VKGLPSGAAAHVEDLVPVSARGDHSWLILSQLSAPGATNHSYGKLARRAGREC
jgi:hypothetical protein